MTENQRAPGRPRVELDLSAVENLAKLQCTEEEIAAFFGVSSELIRRRKKSDMAFRGALEKGRDQGKTSLRRLQWKSAVKGNVAMLIWLGKQHLGQAEPKQQLEHSGDASITGPSVIVVRDLRPPDTAPGRENAPEE